MNSPSVTVFIPVYNGAAFLATAVDSILAQSYGDFELLIIDDGSTDESLSIIQSYRDKRIRLLRNESNKGISFTRNRAIKEAKGIFLALLDADDAALPDRLQTQVDFLVGNPNVAACGSHARIIMANGTQKGTIHVPVEPDDVKTQLVFRNVFVNSTMMFRVDVLRQTAGYYNGLCEDYEMAVRLNQRYVLTNIDAILVLYRMHESNTSTAYHAEMRLAEKYVIQQIHRQLGMPADEKRISVHHAILSGVYNHSFSLDDYAHLLQMLKRANARTAIYPQPAFDKRLFGEWYGMIRKSGQRNAIRRLLQKPFFQWRFVSFKMIRNIIKQNLRF